MLYFHFVKCCGDHSEVPLDLLSILYLIAVWGCYKIIIIRTEHLMLNKSELFQPILRLKRLNVFFIRSLWSGQEVTTFAIFSLGQEREKIYRAIVLVFLFLSFCLLFWTANKRNLRFVYESAFCISVQQEKFSCRE